MLIFAAAVADTVQHFILSFFFLFIYLIGWCEWYAVSKWENGTVIKILIFFKEIRFHFPFVCSIRMWTNLIIVQYTNRSCGRIPIKRERLRESTHHFRMAASKDLVQKLNMVFLHWWIILTIYSNLDRFKFSVFVLHTDLSTCSRVFRSAKH